MRRLSVLVLFALLFPVTVAHAKTSQDQDLPQTEDTADQQASPELPPPEKPAQKWNKAEKPMFSGEREPDLIAFGASAVDFDKDEPRTRGTDFRLEYRWGLFAFIRHFQLGMNFDIHPLAGAQGSTNGQLYGFGGFAFDWVLFQTCRADRKRSPSGLFDSGDGVRPAARLLH